MELNQGSLRGHGLFSPRGAPPERELGGPREVPPPQRELGRRRVVDRAAPPAQQLDEALVRQGLRRGENLELAQRIGRRAGQIRQRSLESRVCQDPLAL